jgi:NADH-quinone oxidoreductase subunit L
MLIGTLAITGVGIPLTTIGFAGFLSKDAIIESAFASGNGYAFWLLVIAAGMTSFYSWRLMFMTFWGKERGDHHAHEHAHESPMVMLVPLGVLALGAAFGGMVWYNSFFGDHAKVLSFFGMPHHETAMAEGEHAAAPAEHGTAPVEHVAATETHAAEAPATEGHGPVAGVAPQGAIFMAETNTVMNDAHHAPAWVKVSPFIAMLIGLALSYLFYIVNPKLPVKLAEAQPALYQFLLNKWYFDELYDAIFIRPAKWLGNFLWKKGDGRVIDGLINGVALGVVPWLTRLAGRVQSGYLFHYAFAMVIGIVVLMFWVVLTGGSH